MSVEVRQLDLVPLPPLRRGEPLLAFRLPLEPQVASRGRVGIVKVQGKPRGTIFDEPHYKAWKRDADALLVAYWRGRQALRLPLIVRVDSVLPRPGVPVESLVVGKVRIRYPFAWSPGRLPHLGVEDLDNLRKGPLDALVRAGILADDRLVVEDGGSGKWYAAEGEEPCVEIRAWHA